MAMNKWILTSLILLIALPSYIVYGQGEQCPKLRIGVYLNSIFAADTTAGYLNEKHKKNFTTSEWVNEIEAYLLETLNSAGYDNLEFFLPAANPGTEMDKVSDLVDGSISPLGKVTTDDMGVAWIDYKAGQQDKQVKITATFTPPGYPEEVKGEATINIRPLEYEATLTVSGHYKKTQSSSYNEASSTGVSDGTYSLNESREASFYVPLKFEYAYDVAIQNQRWEFYRPLDINLSSFSASLRIRDYTHAESKTGGFRQTITTTKTPVNRRIAAKDYLLQSNIILIIDKKTDKVVKIATGGFGVEFEWTGSVKATGREWSVDPPSEKPINRTDPVNEDDTFNAQPVEDLIPDPTYTSVSESVRKYMKDLGTPLPARIEIPEDEEIPEVEPDLLVKFGDGKTYFGGDGKKIVDNSEGPTMHREEYNFSWQVTRRKKP